MSHKALLMFETALQKALPNTDSGAVSEFELLLKARKKAKAEAPATAPAAEATPAPAPEAAADDLPEVGELESLGRKSGKKPQTFDEQHPYVRAGKKYKMAYIRSIDDHVVVGEDHPSYKNIKAKEYETKHSPFEHLARLGHEQQREISQMSADDQKRMRSNYNHPDHKYHLAYISKLVTENMNPLTEHVKANRNKKAGGLNAAQQQEYTAAGMWNTTNQAKKSSETPRHSHDLFNRIAADSDNASSFAHNTADALSRSTVVTASLNRMYHAARELGHKRFSQMSAGEFSKHARTNYELRDFSQARVAPGFTADHLGMSHNPMAAGDYDAKGNPTHEPIGYHHPKNRAKGAPTHGLYGMDNARDMMTHMHSLPVGKGSSGMKGQELLHDYVTPAIKQQVLDTHASIFKMNEPS